MVEPATLTCLEGAPEDLSESAYIDALRRQMIKFATLQLSDPNLAEDVVQEALMGALRNARSFSRRAALKTWVFAILKNKIADALRQRRRLSETRTLLADDEEQEDFSGLFDERGYWQPDERPASWGNPHESLHQAEFWKIFEVCLENLPGNQARVFMMREFVELNADEICSAVGVSSGNLHVMLHRARLRLRECLENRWFADPVRAC